MLGLLSKIPGSVKALLWVVVGIVVLTAGQALVTFSNPDIEPAVIFANFLRTTAVMVGGALVQWAMDNFPRLSRGE